MNVAELLGWLDPLDTYRLDPPTCVTEDFVCWEFDDNNVQLHIDSPGFHVREFINGDQRVNIMTANTMYALNECRTLLAAQQYKGVW